MNTKDLTQRTMARRLPLTVGGAMGLTEGEVQWMDQQDVLFRCSEDLSSYSTVDARVDLGTLGQQVDLQMDRLRRVADPSRGRSSYLHIARYRVRDEESRRRLMKRLRRINPDLIAPVGGWSSDPTTLTSRSRATASRSVTTRRPTRTTPAPSRTGHRPGSSVHSRTATAGHPHSTRSANQSSYRRAQRRPSTPPPARTGLATILSDGDPPAALAVIPDKNTLRRLLRLDGQRMRLQVDPISLPPGTQLLLAIQLPDSTFVQTMARVIGHRPGATQLGADALTPLQVSAIQQHLGT